MLPSAVLISTRVFPCIPYKAMGQPICSLGTMARLTVYMTQQGVQGIYCVVSVVLALQLKVCNILKE